MYSCILILIIVNNHIPLLVLILILIKLVLVKIEDSLARRCLERRGIGGIGFSVIDWGP